MFKKIFAVATLLAVGLMMTTSPARADLQDIKEAGTLRIGVPVDVPPFGFVNEKNQPAGLDIDVAQMIGEALGVKVQIQQITSANRIPYLKTKRLDLVVAAMAETPERARSISFTEPYSVLSIGVFGPPDAKVSDAAGIGDLRVGVARGTTQDMELTKRAPDATIIRFDDDATTVAAYLSSQVDLIASANVIAKSIQDRGKGRPIGEKFIFRYSPLAMGLRQEDTELLKWLNTFISTNMENGAFSELSKKWLGSPLPREIPGQ